MSTSRREVLKSSAVGAVLIAGGRSLLSTAPAQETASMSPQKKAESLGITFEKLVPGYLNKCVRSGNQLITSGHTSKIKGKLGADLKTEDGYKAARECAVEILRSVWNTHGTLDGLKVLKVLGCVNCTPDFIEQPAVVNGCSDLLHEIFGKETDGWHARSALGFASLPSGVAVEIEAIFEIKTG
jgi:enamine deaminase RidA (YjgF/YER057c/UK114 family)